jgi:hypothetical protein
LVLCRASILCMYYQFAWFTMLMSSQSLF